MNIENHYQKITKEEAECLFHPQFSEQKHVNGVQIEHFGVMKEKNALYINAGGSIWGLDWQDDYLVVGGYNSSDEHYGIGDQHTGICVFTVWKLNELIICFLSNWGSIRSLQFMPEMKEYKILAVSCGDGTIRILGILMKMNGYYFVNECLYEFKQEGIFTAMDWRKQQLCVGGSNGSITLFDKPWDNKFAVGHFLAHDCNVQDIRFINDERILSCGADGRLLLHETQDLFFFYEMFRMRGMFMSFDVSNDLCFFIQESRLRCLFKTNSKTTNHFHLSTCWRVRCCCDQVATVSSDGTLIVSLCSKAKNLNPNTIFELKLSKNNYLYQKTTKKSSQDWKYTYHFDPKVAIQTIVWNKDGKSLATGGCNGIIRIQYL